MSTIEETYAALNPKPGRHYCDGEFTSEAEKVRAVLMAVLEEALSTDYIRATNARALHRENIIARIDALGRGKEKREE